MKKFLIAIIGIVIVILLINACATRNVYTNLHPIEAHQVASTLPENNKTQKIAIAFGSGGVRTFLHLGMIKALEEAGIRADIVTGSSGGSIAATLYAQGWSYAMMKELAITVKRDEIADVRFSTMGFLQGQNIAKWINETIGGAHIEETPIPLGIAVTDLNRQKALLVRDGDTGHAVQASVSMPGAFIPVENNDSIIVDGGLLSLVPVRFARAMGADVVIGSDIYCGNIPKASEPGMEVLYTAMRLLVCKAGLQESQEADVLVQYDYEPKKRGSFEDREAMIEAGYKATKAKMGLIRAAIDSNNIQVAHVQDKSE